MNPINRLFYWDYHLEMWREEKPKDCIRNILDDGNKNIY